MRKGDLGDWIISRCNNFLHDVAILASCHCVHYDSEWHNYSGHVLQRRSAERQTASISPTLMGPTSPLCRGRADRDPK